MDHSTVKVHGYKIRKLCANKLLNLFYINENSCYEFIQYWVLAKKYNAILKLLSDHFGVHKEEQKTTFRCLKIF